MNVCEACYIVVMVFERVRRLHTLECQIFHLPRTWLRSPEHPMYQYCCCCLAPSNLILAVILKPHLSIDGKRLPRNNTETTYIRIREVIIPFENGAKNPQLFIERNREIIITSIRMNRF